VTPSVFQWEVAVEAVAAAHLPAPLRAHPHAHHPRAAVAADAAAAAERNKQPTLNFACLLFNLELERRTALLFISLYLCYTKIVDCS